MEDMISVLEDKSSKNSVEGGASDYRFKPVNAYLSKIPIAFPFTFLNTIPHSITKNVLQKTPGAGGHRSEGSTSGSAILAAFIPTFITAVVYLAIFYSIRTRNLICRKTYVPRTFIGTVPEKDRTPSSDPYGSKWFHDFQQLDEKFVLQHQNLDGYLWLRYLRFIILICFVGSCITWPILMPINATGGGNATQLDKITYSNVAEPGRLYAHAIVAWLFLGSVMLLIGRERLFVIGARQASLLSSTNASRLSSRVVLFLSAPDEALKEDNLKRIFGEDARRMWPVSKVDDLESLVEDRNEKAMRLESAEVQLAMTANKKRLDDAKNSSNGAPHDHANERQPPIVPDELRPRHRLTSLFGTKVDTIKWTRRVLPDLAEQIDEKREQKRRTFEADSSSVFVEFSSQAAAQHAYEHVVFHRYLPTQSRYIGIQPKEVLWKNLTLQPSKRVFLGTISTVFVVAMILLWAIPLGIVATLSNITYLTDTFKFLRFINNLPPAILGLITGLLPPYLISTFISYVPKFLRHVAKFSGEPTIPQAELKTQSYYFAFQVIQVFLVTTFSSGAAAVASQIAKDPQSAPALLAENLPKASNFYLTYFILQGLASSASNILNYEDLLEYMFYDRFLDKTPRDKYNSFTQMNGISWGSVYPKFTNMAVIAIAYSCIAPLTLGFATAGMFLYYLTYRYNLLYVTQVKIDTKGEAYARALQHLMTGVYLAELCLIGLFGASLAPGPTTLVVILFISSIVYHVNLDLLLRPLEVYLPESDDSSAPLLVEEGTAEGPRLGMHNLHKPLKPVLSPMALRLQSQITKSRDYIKSILHDPASRLDDPPEYTDDQLKDAYTNPALTSKTPKLWLVRDELGVSKHEIEENEKVGIAATDEGATLDTKNRVQWAHDDLEKVPIFKVPARY